MEDARTVLIRELGESEGREKWRAYISKDSFQGGLRVLRRIAVVETVSPSTMMIAKGSGRLRSSRLARPVAPETVVGGEYELIGEREETDE